MVMKTEKLTIDLVFTTKKIVRLTEELKGKNLSDLYFKALNNSDIKSLATIILAFGELEGKSPFNSDINKVYDFIDEYKKENKKTYEDIYKEIAEVVNEEGFFTKKMTKEELTEKINNPLASLDLEETIKNAANKVATNTMTEAFKGYQG